MHMNPDLNLTPYTETNVKWILNYIKAKATKLLEDLRKKS